MELQKGTSAGGKEWQKKDFVIETLDQYPKKICLKLFNDVANVPLEIGKKYTFHINIESREFNGKWYTNVNCWKFGQPEQVNNNVTNDEQGDYITEVPQQEVRENKEEPKEDDLPF